MKSLLQIKLLNVMKTGLMSLLAIFAFSTANQLYAQDTIMFNFSGAPTQWTAPGCVTDIEITVAGAGGGTSGYHTGGTGAVIQGILTLSPGDVLDINIGGLGPCPGSGYNGGGASFASQNGNTLYDGCGGGGSSNVNVNGVPTIIAGAGGGAGGGGNSTFQGAGGNGGCPNGTQGQSSYGIGGTGGTTTGPGLGGAGWINTPPGGSDGVGGVGGDGGLWNTASGGGGGGGYFGGGGGGNDGCCTGANSGSGGGGGSSLYPVGLGCTPATNTGDGYVMIVIPVCETTICSGDTAFVDFAPQFPAGATNFSVSPPLGAYQAIPGDANIGFHPVDTTIYTITADVGGTPTSIDWPVNAVDPIFPDAGLDDSICFDPVVGYDLMGTLDNDGTMFWEFASATTFGGGVGTALFTPNSTQPNVTATVNLAGEYMYVLHEEDTNAVCPDGLDTVMIYYSEEVHTSTLLDPSCYSYTDGSITVNSDATATSGNLGASQYSIDGGTTWQASPIFNNLGDGTYDLISEDYLGCQFSSQVVLTEPADIVLQLISSDTTICQNGTATLVANGTNAPAGSTYTYYWSQSPDNTSSVQISPGGIDFTSTVYAQTSDGCYSDTLALNVTHHQPISLTITPNDSICPGEASGHTVTATGGFLDGNPDYNYSWTANGAPFGSVTDMVSVNPTVNTTYCVTVSDVCETTPETICSDVIMRRVPQPMFMSDTTWGCIPSIITFTNTTDPIDVDSITWLINGEYYYNENPLKIKFEDAGIYDVWLEVYSEYGCHDAITASNYITIYDSPDALFYTSPNPTTIFDTEIHMTNASSGSNLTYLWSMPLGSPDTSIAENPTTIYPDQQVGQYGVTLTVTNEWGCQDSMLNYVLVDPEILFYAPNIFTPDGDEYNENWRVYIDGIDIYDFHLTIFNRWGELIWESYNAEGVWNGHYGDGGLVDDGVYIWRVECNETGTDRKHEFHGHVTVLK